MTAMAVGMVSARVRSCDFGWTPWGMNKCTRWQDGPDHPVVTHIAVTSSEATGHQQQSLQECMHSKVALKDRPMTGTVT